MTEPVFVDKRAVKESTTLSSSALYRLRKSGQWEAGIHYVEFSRTKVLYNLALVLDWLANQHQLHLHEQAIRAYLASLPSQNPPNKKPGRKNLEEKK